jgi:ABC-type branched-subunit amino acid transport system substrate-binding protein
VRPRTLVAIAALVSALVAACDDAPPDPGSGVVIGAILPLSGPDGESGRDLLHGLELAAAASDPPITVLPVDGEGKAAASARRLRELAHDPLVDVVVGGWLASTARTLAAVATAEAVPFIALSPLAGPSIRVPGSDLFLLHRLEALGQASAAFAREDLGAENAGVFRIEGSAASRALADAFAREFTAGGGQIAWTLAPDEQDRLALPRGPEMKVEVLYVGGPSEWAERCVDLARRSRGAAVLLADGWRLDSVEALVAADVPVYVTGFFSETDPSAPARALLDACAAAEVLPSPAVAFGWDAVQLVRHAASAGVTRDALRSALRVSDAVAGASGRVGHPIPSRTREAPAVSSATPGGFVFVRRVEVAPLAPASGA